MTTPTRATLTPPYLGWRPYCLVCSTMLRMLAKAFGFECQACGNQIRHDLTRRGFIWRDLAAALRTATPTEARKTK